MEQFDVLLACRHKISQRLEEALDVILQTKPSDPLINICRILRGDASVLSTDSALTGSDNFQKRE